MSHHYPDARFLTSADAARQFVPDTGCEVAVAGRSNAGKSSAINVIVNRSQLAHTGKKPGRTRLVNFFELRPDARLVDLPGYGYARVSAAMRQHWEQLIADYFASRRSLTGLMVVVDIRRCLTDFDRQMMAFAGAAGLPMHLLLSKADKLKKSQAAAALLQVRREVGERAGVQTFSALKREGTTQARAVLEQWLAA